MLLPLKPERLSQYNTELQQIFLKIFKSNYSQIRYP